MLSEGPRFSIETRAGRLIEARVFGLKTREDADDYSRALGLAAMQLGRARPILCADHRPVIIYPQPAADRLVELFLQMNSVLERVAIVVAPTNATMNLQLDRLVREARFVSRRMVRTPKDAEMHLAPVLQPDELRRLRDFLDEFTVSLI